MIGGFAERRWRPLLVSLLLLGAAVRLGVHLDLAAADPTFLLPQMDGRVYLDQARAIAVGEGIGARPYFLNPLYPYLLAPLARLGEARMLDGILLLQGLLGLATVWLVAATGRRVAGAGAGVLAGLLAALWPVLLWYEEKPMVVAVAVFLNAALLHVLVRFAGRPRARTAFAAGILLGLGLLARPNLLVFLVLLVPFLAALAPVGGRARFLLSRGGALVLGVLLCVAPVTIRNAVVGGDFVVLTTGAGPNLWQANGPAAIRTGWMISDELRGHPVGMERDAKAVAEREAGRALAPSEVSAWWTRRTLSYAAAHPGATVVHLLRKAYGFFRALEEPSSYHYAAETRETAFLGRIPLTFGLLSPLAAAGAILALRRNPRARAPAILFLSYLVALVIVHPYSHHRAPVLPAAFVLAATAVAGLVSLARRSRRAFAVAIAALLLATVGAHATTIAHAAGASPLSEEAFFRAHETAYRVNHGIALLDLGREDPAEAELLRARDLSPDSPQPWRALAEVARRRGEPATEALRLREAVARDPEDGAALARLADLALRAGDRDRALRRAEQARRAGRPDAMADVVLGRLRLAGGDAAGALESFERAAAGGIDAPELLAEQSEALRRLGRSEEALRRAEEGLRRSPDSAPLLLERAWGRATASPPDLDGARADVRRVRAAGLPVPAALESLVTGYVKGL